MPLEHVEREVQSAACQQGEERPPPLPRHAPQLGEEEAEGALAKGVRRVLVRLLGLPAKRFQAQSPSCRVEEREGNGDLGGSLKSPFVRPGSPTAGR